MWRKTNVQHHELKNPPVLLDFEKVYNRMSHQCLRVVLRDAGLPDNRVSIILVINSWFIMLIIKHTLTPNSSLIRPKTGRTPSLRCYLSSASSDSINVWHICSRITRVYKPPIRPAISFFLWKLLNGAWISQRQGDTLPTLWHSGIDSTPFWTENTWPLPSSNHNNTPPPGLLANHELGHQPPACPKTLVGLEAIQCKTA